MGLSRTIRFAAAAVSISLVGGSAAIAAPPPGPTAASTMKAPPRPLSAVSAVPPPPNAPAPASAVPAQVGAATSGSTAVPVPGLSVTAGLPAAPYSVSHQDLIYDLRATFTDPTNPESFVVFSWTGPDAAHWKVFLGAPSVGPYYEIANVNTTTYTKYWRSRGQTIGFVVRWSMDGKTWSGNSNEVIVTWPAP